MVPKIDLARYHVLCFIIYVLIISAFRGNFLINCSGCIMCGPRKLFVYHIQCVVQPLL